MKQGFTAAPKDRRVSGMVSASNSNNAATGTADAGSYEHLKDFYEQISTDSNGKNSCILSEQL